jgi:hypothetical protein
LEAIWALEFPTEKAMNKKPVSAAFDGTEIMAHPCGLNLKSGLALSGTQPIGAIIQQTESICARL